MISSHRHSQDQDYAEEDHAAIGYHDIDAADPQQQPQQPQDSLLEQSMDRSVMLLLGMREQIEFYFSINNYTRDMFLQQVVATHQGSVPTSVIAQFPKIQQLYHEMMQYFYANNPTFVAPIEVMVCRSLAPSHLVDVSNDGHYLRPNWTLLQDQDGSAAFHNDSGPVVKSVGMNHTDATNTTVSPTSFASGSDGSVGPHSAGGDAKLPPETLPLMFNPTGGVYYIPPPQPFQYGAFAAYHPYYPPMGVVPSVNIQQSYPVAASFYRPYMDATGQYYMPEHHYVPAAAPHPHYFTHPPPPPPSNQGPMTYLDGLTKGDPYGKVTVAAMPSPSSLNAPPSVIRLQDPFHDDTIHSRNFQKPQQQGARKKNKNGKGRVNRQSSSDNSSGLSNGRDTSSHPGEISAQLYQTDREMTIKETTTTNTSMKANQSKNDDISSDGNSRNGMPIPKKEKNRVPVPVAGSHQSRTHLLRPQLPNHARGNRGGNKSRSNSNNKSEGSGMAVAAKSVANILIDENFPCLSKVANNDAVGKEESKASSIEDCNKKKYAEALLYKPAIPNKVSTQSAVVVTTPSREIGTTTGTTGGVPTEVPKVTNLLSKFNLQTEENGSILPSAQIQ